MQRSKLLPLSLGAAAAVGLPAALARAADRSHLTVGTVSTSAQRDHLWSCRTSFDASQAGASGKGPWFNSDGTWDATRKPSVSGSVAWPNADLRISVTGAARAITGNALPVGQRTGTFPIAKTDPVYTFDANPNRIQAQSVTLTLPAAPQAGAAQCVGGEVGISLAGPPIFAAIDAGGRDAQAFEVQDACSGHPQVSGVYHFHGWSGCGSRSAQFGWALDGYAIWGPVDPASGKALTNSDLDECHGTTSEITIDGRSQRAYHYVANDEYPYTVGCFRAAPAARTVTSGQTGQTGQTSTTQPGGGQAGGGQAGGQAGGPTDGPRGSSRPGGGQGAPAPRPRPGGGAAGRRP